MAHEEVLERIRGELKRVGASHVQATLDRDFEPEAGELVRVQIESAEWRLLPEEFEQLLKDLPAGAGGEAIKQAIELRGSAVWHGPAPKDSRDTSHRPT